MVRSRKFEKKKRLDAPCAPAEEKPVCLFLVSDFLRLFLLPTTKACPFIKPDVYINYT
ncbi:hypothetical protein HMPREF0083_03399 [Aneurinibacillus aneurinilyticus ATCC 12856]|uniref:Uncharacterized protein n=1 Tax=Aneurinibacillus aneurinilyticus ATCC 12856 TaxID=649747 RepID=U1WIY2_ANEAE|nr:hypothetical protein HMPREF0083_03399 [Aneurinibacillus aneurinilyticus ATCC 12856]